jgi:hypothetical protein
MLNDARNSWRRGIRGLGVALLVIAGPDPVPTMGQDEALELYLLEVQADGNVLADSLPAFFLESEESTYLDFALFLEAIEFPIVRSGSTWSGWFHSEAHSYLWDVAAGTVEIADREPESVAEAQWFEAEDGIFVVSSLLESWFELTLDIDRRQQALRVSSQNPLPFQVWEERALARLSYRRAEKLEPDEYVVDEYNWATKPLFNVSSQIAIRGDEGRRVTTNSTSIVAGMDLLKHSLIFSGSFGGGSSGAASTDDTTRRLTLERYAETPEKPIFGNVHHYMLGDIYQGAPNLVMRSGTGRGFVINRYDDGTTAGSSAVTITDIAPPGWEVELYRNETLIDFATVGPDGRYYFPEQDIHFGENLFLIRLFGPQGQVREDRRTFWGGGIELEPGDYDFSISHLDFSDFLLDGPPDNVEALAASYATDLRYSRAVSRDAEVGAALTRTGLGTRERDGNFTDDEYLSVFGRSRVGPGVLIGEAVSQQSAGQALSLEYLTGFAGHTFSVSHRLFDDYDSPATLQAEPVDALTEISALGTFGKTRRSGYRAGIRYREIRAGAGDYRLFSRIGTVLGPVSLTNELEHRINGGENSTRGHLRLAGRAARVSIRGQVDYEFGGHSPFRQISVSMNHDVSGRINHNLTLSRNIAESDRSYLSNLVSVRVRDVDLSFGVSSDFDRYWSVGAGVNVAFGYDARRSEFMTDFLDLAQTGRVTMNLFVDENNNGLRDEGEAPVHWAKYREQETPASTPGSLTLTGLPKGMVVQIDTRHFRFEDPFLAPSVDAYEVRTHAGSDVDIDVAVVMLGDIEGTILSPDGQPLRGVTLVLLDSNGSELALGRSEFDGYYSFAGLPSGVYQIAVPSDEETLVVLQSVTLDARDGYTLAEVIVLEPERLTETSP